APLISTFKAVPPNTLNHRTAIIPGTSKTPVINWRTVRPLEIRAINKPIKGAQAMCQAQKKIVFLPSQSLSVKGVKVKDMGTILEIYPPNVVTKLSAINKVGPKIIINNTKIAATAIFVLLKSRIPLSSPEAAEIMNKTVTIAIIISRSEERRVGKE